MTVLQKLAEVSGSGYIFLLNRLSPTCSRMEIRCINFGNQDIRVFAPNEEEAFGYAYNLWKSGKSGVFDYTRLVEPVNPPFSAR